MSYPTNNFNLFRAPLLPRYGKKTRRNGYRKINRNDYNYFVTDEMFGHYMENRFQSNFLTEKDGFISEFAGLRNVLFSVCLTNAKSSGNIDSELLANAGRILEAAESYLRSHSEH